MTPSRPIGPCGSTGRLFLRRRTRTCRTGWPATLAVWAAYGLSGAGVIRRLPLLRLALVLISGAYLVRGLFGVPVERLGQAGGLGQ